MSQAIKKEIVSGAEALKVVRLQVASGGRIPAHHSNVDVVVTVVRGSGTFTVEDAPRAVGPGDVIVMPPRAQHSIDADSELELIVVHARLSGVGAAATCGA